MTVTAIPLTGFLGAQLTGLDLSRPIDRQAKAEVLDLFHAHQVVPKELLRVFNPEEMQVR